MDNSYKSGEVQVHDLNLILNSVRPRELLVEGFLNGRAVTNLIKAVKLNKDITVADGQWFINGKPINLDKPINKSYKPSDQQKKIKADKGFDTKITKIIEAYKNSKDFHGSTELVYSSPQAKTSQVESPKENQISSPYTPRLQLRIAEHEKALDEDFKTLNRLNEELIIINSNLQKAKNLPAPPNLVNLKGKVQEKILNHEELKNKSDKFEEYYALVSNQVSFNWGLGKLMLNKKEESMIADLQRLLGSGITRESFLNINSLNIMRADVKKELQSSAELLDKVKGVEENTRKNFEKSKHTAIEAEAQKSKFCEETIHFLEAQIVAKSTALGKLKGASEIPNKTKSEAPVPYQPEEQHQIPIDSVSAETEPLPDEVVSSAPITKEAKTKSKADALYLSLNEGEKKVFDALANPEGGNECKFFPLVMLLVLKGSNPTIVKDPKNPNLYVISSAARNGKGTFPDIPKFENLSYEVMMPKEIKLEFTPKENMWVVVKGPKLNLKINFNLSDVGFSENDGKVKVQYKSMLIPSKYQKKIDKFEYSTSKLSELIFKYEQNFPKW